MLCNRTGKAEGLIRFLWRLSSKNILYTVIQPPSQPCHSAGLGLYPTHQLCESEQAANLSELFPHLKNEDDDAFLKERRTGPADSREVSLCPPAPSPHTWERDTQKSRQAARLTSPPLAYSITKHRRSWVWKAYFSACGEGEWLGLCRFSLDTPPQPPFLPTGLAMGVGSRGGSTLSSAFWAV